MNGADESLSDISPTLFDTAMYESATDNSERLWPTPRGTANANRDTKAAPSMLAGTHGWSLRAAVSDEHLFRPSISSAAASPASPSATLVGDWAPKTNAGSGRSSSESYARLGPDGHWLRMYQDSFQLMTDGSLEECSGTWPRAGVTQSGTAYQRPPSVPRTSEIGSSSWPTPRANDNDQGYRGEGSSWLGQHRGETLANAAHRFPTPVSGMADRGDRGDLNTVVKSYGSPSGHTKMYPPPLPSDVDGGRTTKGRKRQNETGLRRMVATPTQADGLGGPGSSGRVGGQLNPTWVEWLQGFPMGWTEVD